MKKSLSDYKQVRCNLCNARLFDMNGKLAKAQANGVEIRIKCWRCGSIVHLYIEHEQTNDHDTIEQHPKIA